MIELFLKIINMSISTSWLVLAVLILRLACRKAPRWVHVLLWGIVAVRLICPISMESRFSLIPSAQTFPEEVISGPSFDVQTGIDPVDDRINDYLEDRYFEGVTVPANHGANIMTVLTTIWAAGMLLLAVYTAVSYRRLRRRTDTAVLYRDNIFQSENVALPFVLGLAKPRIYLPFHMDGQTLNHVIAHEQAHIRRRDHWWKPLGFLLLTIHWFNPLMWLAYMLLCRDIELACDEKVIKDLSSGQRADYTQALVACSVDRPLVAACPLAFGEVGVKERVKAVMNYKKPGFWIVVVAVIACAAAAVCFLTDPVEPTVDDVTSQNGYVLLGQEEVELTLSVPKSALPDAAYTAEGYEFEPGEVVACRAGSTVIYLHKVMLSNESDELMYFMFDFSTEIADYGSFASPYRYSGDGSGSSIGGNSIDLRDESSVYPDAVSVRGIGSGDLIAFYVSTDACLAAEGKIEFDYVFNRVFYAKNGYEDEAAELYLQ